MKHFLNIFMRVSLEPEAKYCSSPGWLQRDFTVDWWGLNLYNSSQFSMSYTSNFPSCVPATAKSRHIVTLVNWNSVGRLQRSSFLTIWLNDSFGAFLWKLLAVDLLEPLYERNPSYELNKFSYSILIWMLWPWVKLSMMPFNYYWIWSRNLFEISLNLFVNADS